MGKRQQAVYYRALDGTQPVLDFIASLSPERQAVLDAQLERFNELDEDDPPPAFPHSSQIDGQLRELRCHYGSELYRVLYRRWHHFVVLLHAFRKTTGAVPPAAIKLANARWIDFEARMKEKPRRPPRAAGRDAP